MSGATPNSVLPGSPFFRVPRLLGRITAGPKAPALRAAGRVHAYETPDYPPARMYSSDMHVNRDIPGPRRQWNYWGMKDDPRGSRGKNRLSTRGSREAVARFRAGRAALGGDDSCVFAETLRLESSLSSSVFRIHKKEKQSGDNTLFPDKICRASGRTKRNLPGTALSNAGLPSFFFFKIPDFSLIFLLFPDFKIIGFPALPWHSNKTSTMVSSL